MVYAALFPASIAQAQSADEDELALVYGDKSMVSIATGSRQPLRRAPAVATVITTEDIAAMGATDLDHVLETVPGLHVSYSPIYAPVYIVRGIGASSPNNPQILVLQNGIPMTTAYTGDKGLVWGGLPVENIARIEIIRGPGSALYGADAYSGVINIITKSAAEVRGTRVGIRGGSFGTGDAWMQHGGKLGPLDMAAYLRVGHTDGFAQTVTADAQSARDAVFGTHASRAPGPVHLGRDAIDGSLDVGYGKWRFTAGYKLRDNVENGAGVAQSLDPVGRYRSERFTTDVSWADPQFAKDWSAGLTLGYLRYAETTPTNLQLSPPGTQFPTGTFPNGLIGSPSRWEDQVRLSIHANYSGFAEHNLRLGAGHDDMDLYKATTFKNYLLSPVGVPVPTGAVIDYSDIQPHILPQRRKTDYVNVQDEWQFARDWALTAGVRHDNFSDFGRTTNPRLALVWDATLDVTAKLLYGRAFRAPSFNEQYGINPVANGNPNLRPETISTLEAAFSWQARKDIELNLSLFRYSMQDIIRAVPNTAPAPGLSFNNSGGQDGHGLELEAMWAVGKNLRFSGNYAFQRSIDVTTNTDAGYAPHHHLYARADWRFSGAWLLSPQVNWVADRRRVTGDNRPAVVDYSTVDIALRTANGNNNRWDFSASVRNLFNADAREPSPTPALSIPNDLPMAPRTLYVQAVYRFD